MSEGGEARLSQTLSVGQAIGLGVTIVVGSGLLILPGLAYREAEGAALYAWVVNLLIVIPLLVIFGYLGARYPSAGGIAGFVQVAFGRAGAAATEVLLIGTFGLGIPAIAVTGGNYLSELVSGGEAGRVVGTYALLAIAAGVNLLGSKISGRTQQVLAAALVMLIGLVGVIALGFGTRAGAGIAPLDAWTDAIPAVGLVFFAFTGWEMLSFTAEEYKNPRRDFPLAIAGSFVAVVVLYMLIAVAVQVTLPPTSPELVQAPLASMLSTVIGSAGARAVAALGVVIIGANLIGAVWAASRLVFSSAREGLLPPVLARLETGAKTPRVSVTTTAVGFAVVAALHFADVVSLELLLRLAGQNFFVLYGLSVLAFLRIARGAVMRAIGVASVLLVAVTMGTFGWGLAYTAGLLLLGAALHARGRMTTARRAAAMPGARGRDA